MAAQNRAFLYFIFVDINFGGCGIGVLAVWNHSGSE